jgi:glutathione S-transferase
MKPDADPVYESNVLNQYLDQVFESPRLMPEDPKERAYARFWMAFGDEDFFPAVFAVNVGRERGFPEERISKALKKLNTLLVKLEERLQDREYLADRFSLADVAYAGNFVRLRELAEKGTVTLTDYPNVATWIERIEARGS